MHNKTFVCLIKMVHEIYNTAEPVIHFWNNEDLRGNTLKLFTSSVVVVVVFLKRKKTVKFWNEPPEDVVWAPSVNFQ